MASNDNSKTAVVQTDAGCFVYIAAIAAGVLTTERTGSTAAGWLVFAVVPLAALIIVAALAKARII